MSNPSLKWLRSIFAARMLIAAVMAVGPASAHAHAVLVESSVRDRVVSPQAPAVVVARFSRTGRGRPRLRPKRRR